jgi:hypothetical protein
MTAHEVRDEQPRARTARGASRRAATRRGQAAWPALEERHALADARGDGDGARRVSPSMRRSRSGRALRDGRASAGAPGSSRAGRDPVESPWNEVASSHPPARAVRGERLLRLEAARGGWYMGGQINHEFGHEWPFRAGILHAR